MLIYLIRHGSTEWNEKDLVQGLIDLELSKIGISQVKKTGEFFNKKNIKKIFTSPLKRALQTAEILNEKLNSEISIVEELRELDCGVWEGMKMDDVREKYRDVYQKLMESPFTKIPEGESFSDVVERFRIGWKKVLKSVDYSSEIIVVGHIVIIRAFLYENMKIPYSIIRNFRIDNSSISIFEKIDERYIMKLWNYRVW